MASLEILCQNEVQKTKEQVSQSGPFMLGVLHIWQEENRWAALSPSFSRTDFCRCGVSLRQILNMRKAKHQPYLDSSLCRKSSHWLRRTVCMLISKYYFNLQSSYPLCAEEKINLVLNSSFSFIREVDNQRLNILYWLPTNILCIYCLL